MVWCINYTCDYSIIIVVERINSSRKFKNAYSNKTVMKMESNKTSSKARVPVIGISNLIFDNILGHATSVGIISNLKLSFHFLDIIRNQNHNCENTNDIEGTHLFFVPEYFVSTS